jgi:hypothetical protein
LIGGGITGHALERNPGCKAAGAGEAFAAALARSAFFSFFNVIGGSLLCGGTTGHARESNPACKAAGAGEAFAAALARSALFFFNIAVFLAVAHACQSFLVQRWQNSHDDPFEHPVFFQFQEQGLHLPSSCKAAPFDQVSRSGQGTEI